MRVKSRKILYLVEGESEQYFIDTIKTKYIIQGRTRKFNLWQRDVSNLIREISRGTIVICILDTDVICDSEQIRLNTNIKKLRKNYEVIIVNQNKNLEQEIILATSLTNISEMYGLKGEKHKAAFINDKSLMSRLESLDFNIIKLWVDSSSNIKLYPKN